MAVGSDFIENALKKVAAVGGYTEYTQYNTVAFTCGATTQEKTDANKTVSSSNGSATVVLRHPALSGTDYFDVTVPLSDPCTIELIGDDDSVGATYTAGFDGAVSSQSVIFTIGIGVL